MIELKYEKKEGCEQFKIVRVPLKFLTDPMLHYNFDIVTNFSSAFGITKTSTLIDASSMF